MPTRKRPPGAITPGQLLPIVVTVLLLVGVIVMKSRCGSAVGNLFKAIDQPPAAHDAGKP
jgi:hypothetical protein